MRMEKDSMGEMSVPESALYGASTQRAVLNFPISGYRFPRPFIRALGLLKWAAAQANHDLGLLDAHRSALIVQAAEEVIEGKLGRPFSTRHFPDRFRHEHQYQRERSHFQPMLSAREKGNRLARSHSSERPRQHGSVE